jgi:hypothetical protein
MIILHNTDTLQIVLGAAKTANDMDVTVVYRNVGATTFAHARQLSKSNGLTDVDILTAPATCHQYMIDTISIFNKDTHFL